MDEIHQRLVDVAERLASSAYELNTTMIDNEIKELLDIAAAVKVGPGTPKSWHSR